MALAVVFDELIRRGEVRSYAELAAIAQVSRARLSQVMNLLNLTPRLQEELLLLPPSDGPEAVSERELRAVRPGQAVWPT